MYKRCVQAALLISIASNAVADTYTRDDLVLPPRPERFTMCYHGTCADIAEVHLAKPQWQAIRALFTPESTPAEERAAIRQAIAQLETMVGQLTGTEVDKAGTFEHLGEPGQLDCIDESTNTSFYLQMMANDRLLHWHSVEDRVTRGFFLFGWPHTTAVIRDTRSNERYAVDSWFLDNGQPPYILPLSQWEDGWTPDKH